MKILLLSPYDANSHQYWWRLLKAHFSGYNWTVLTLPARYFNWRIRSNSLTWSQQQQHVLQQEYDLCIATSMTDLATLRGLLPSLAAIPTLLYFHENQVAYPLSNKAEQRQNIEPIMVQIYSSLAANHLSFNSCYNRDSFFSGLKQLLKRFPDAVPPNLLVKLEKKSSVLAVPIAYRGTILVNPGLVNPRSINTSSVNKMPANNRSLNMLTNHGQKQYQLVWNHRWEYDKGCQRLLAFIQAMPAQTALTLHVVGQSFRQVPPEFEKIKAELSKRGWLGQWGYLKDIKEYHQLLEQSHFVLSTAEHDFQGLSVLEAVARECIPIVPDRLAYCEMFDDRYRYASDSDLTVEAQSMAQKVQYFLASENIPHADVSRFYMDNLATEYEQLFASLVNSA
ncbi:tRNA-queuosine alpha-mannosyltransferase domain-containing protein [Agarilytica rhodophyticola]|uniref:tRNA-queuosine alpha-mannosyltransferase domain-containing protein n=1 Tax=Agarilytica rhodophyticola TaxID=1737490 RepID=UPI000B344EE7|nr:DUF3524 domain-containing protein [Agarilytica rhodophyticola]